MKWGGAILCLLVGVGSTQTMAQEAGSEPMVGPAAFGDWRMDAPGRVRWIRPEDLPRAYATRSSSNGPTAARLPASPALRVPPGLKVELWAQGFEGPRTLKVAPNGDVFVAETAAGTIKIVRPQVGGKAGPARVFASGLDGPFGMAFYPSGLDPHWLYVATTTAVLRFDYSPGEVTSSAAPTRIADLGISDGGHSTRDLVFSRDGTRMYVSVGSQSNVAEGMSRHAPPSFPQDAPLGAAWDDEERRADVLVFEPDGTHRRVFATGLRNCVGLALAPASDDLYCSTNERDGMGDDLPPDYVTRVKDGAFFGWPWFYIGDHEDPRHTGERRDLAGRVSVPDVLIQPHSAPLAMTFYDPPDKAPSALPRIYAGSAFVALHGSWNRAKRTGYKVVRIIMKNHVPEGVYEDFLIGFINPDGSVWGRPVGIAAANDGALLVSEDEHGTLWRVSSAP